MPVKKRKLSPPKAKQIPPPDVALIDYLRLGTKRSISALVRFYENNRKYAVPNRDTLSEWSGKHDWPARAEEYDRQVWGETHSRAVQEHAQANIDAAKHAEIYGCEIIDRCRMLLEKAQKPEQLEILSKIAADMLRLSTELRGVQVQFVNPLGAVVTEPGNGAGEKPDYEKLKGIIAKATGHTVQ